MKQIQRDFVIRELIRICGCTLGLAACLLFLSLFSDLASWRPAFLLLFLAVVLFAAMRLTLQQRISARALNDSDLYQIENEYAAPHPVYRAASGEIHLLDSFIVCRNRGRLLFIPVEKIERVEERYQSSGLLRFPFLKFTMDNDRKVSIDFSLRRRENVQMTIQWLESRIGAEKVIRMEGTPSAAKK